MKGPQRSASALGAQAAHVLGWPIPAPGSPAPPGARRQGRQAPRRRPLVAGRRGHAPMLVRLRPPHPGRPAMRLPRLLRRRRRLHLYELLGGPGAGQLAAAEPLDDRFDVELAASWTRPAPRRSSGASPARWPGSGASMTWDGLPVTQGPKGELYVTAPWPASPVAQRFPVERLDPAELDEVMRSPGPLMPGTDE
jgi:hypothetical protein